MPAPARKKPTAAVAARREVRAEKNTPAPVDVKFRGETFSLPRDRLGSARVFMRQQHLQRFGTTAEGTAALLFELLGPVDAARFIDLCDTRDNLYAAASEFITALNKAQNVPNS